MWIRGICRRCYGSKIAEKALQGEWPAIIWIAVALLAAGFLAYAILFMGLFSLN